MLIFHRARRRGGFRTRPGPSRRQRGPRRSKWIATPLPSEVHQLFETRDGIVEVLVRHFPKGCIQQAPMTPRLGIAYFVRPEIHKALAPGLHLILREASKPRGTRTMAIEDDHVFDRGSRSDCDGQIASEQFHPDLSVRSFNKELVRELRKQLPSIFANPDGVRIPDRITVP